LDLQELAEARPRVDLGRVGLGVAQDDLDRRQVCVSSARVASLRHAHNCAVDARGRHLAERPAGILLAKKKALLCGSLLLALRSDSNN